MTRYSISFSTRQLEVCWKASALDTCMNLHFTTGCVGRLPVISTGWSVEDTNLTGYLCVPVWPLLMLCFVFWLALHCLSRLRPPNKEYCMLNPVELVFRQRQSVHSALRHNSEKAVWLFFYPACFVLELTTTVRLLGLSYIFILFVFTRGTKGLCWWNTNSFKINHENSINILQDTSSNGNKGGSSPDFLVQLVVAICIHLIIHWEQTVKWF